METYSEKMLVAINEGDSVEAQLQFENALKNDTPEILAALGEQLMGAGFIDEAQLIFEQLLEEFPTEFSLYIPLAEIAIENDKTDDAFDYLEKIPKSDPSYVEALMVTADIYQVLGVPEVSIKKIEEAKTIMPNEPVLTLALAEIYFTMNQYVKSAELYEQLRGTSITETINLDERIGTAYGMVGEFEEAIPYLEKANQDDPTDERAFQLAITYIQVGARDKAIVLLEQLRLLNPTFEALYLPLASALLDEGELPKAEEVIAEGIRQNPYSVDMFHLASDNAYRLGKIPDAEEYLRRAILLEDSKEFSIMKLANLLLADERYEDVIDTLSEFRESDEPQAFWTLAQAYNALEEYSEAAMFFEKALPGLNHEPEFLKEYGLFLREEGQLEKANALLSHYLEHVPDDMDVHELLG